jgi:hypothetical protein
MDDKNQSLDKKQEVTIFDADIDNLSLPINKIKGLLTWCDDIASNYTQYLKIINKLESIDISENLADKLVYYFFEERKHRHLLLKDVYSIITLVENDEQKYWHESCSQKEKEIDNWQSKYKELEEQYHRALNVRDAYLKLLNEKPGAKKFNVRQTAIIALALCRKGDIVPKNKKSIAPFFHEFTGYSANTIGQNLCSSYTDEEVEEIAKAIEDHMPDFAKYLRENKFSASEIKK